MVRLIMLVKGRGSLNHFAWKFYLIYIYITWFSIWLLASSNLIYYPGVGLKSLWLAIKNSILSSLCLVRGVPPPYVTVESLRFNRKSSPAWELSKKSFEFSRSSALRNVYSLPKSSFRGAILLDSNKKMWLLRSWKHLWESYWSCQVEREVCP